MCTCTLAEAQCYVDPSTGRQICTPSGPTVDASAHCRITVGDGSTGSGTLAARDEEIGLVLTCSHLFDASTDNIVVSFPNGQRYAARLLDRDRAHDLAALAIRAPDVAPLRLSDEEPSSPLSACGFGPNGQFSSVHGSILGNAVAVGAAYPSLMIAGAVRPGDSGGGVLSASGQLVGIVWGQRGGATYATCGRPLREFLKRIRRRQPPASPGVGTPDVAWQAWRDQIEDRISALDAKKQDKGDYLQAGDLNGYLRVADAPTFDESQFARRSELDGGLKSVIARFLSIQSRIESVKQRVEEVAVSKVGFFQGLSFGKLLAGTLGLSGPLALAVIAAGGLAGRRRKSRVESQGSRAGNDLALDSRPSTLDPKPVAVDSPPLPQRTVPETHYVPYEKDSFAKAHQWASEHVARKYPGATEVLQALDSLIKQYLAATK